MIYVTTKYSEDYNDVVNIWDVNFDNVEELYKKFIMDKSIEMNIVINNHWLNIMYYEPFHPHLTKTEYNNLSKKWKKFLRLWDKDKFISEKLNGVKIEFKILCN